MIIYTCTDSFEAMMTCIYDAWASKAGHQNIRLMTEPVYEMELFCEYRHVDVDFQKSEKVIRSICKQIGYKAYQSVFRCAISNFPDKLDRIYRFLLVGFSYPKEVFQMLQHPYVMNMYEVNRAVSNEVHSFREFIRFQELPNQVLVAHIEPKSNLLSLLFPAFDDRMPSENWMIVDDIRKIAAIHPADRETFLSPLEDDEFTLLTRTEHIEDPFMNLWKTFFQTIAIKERTNPVCQRNHLPIWYRKHMTEFSS